MVTIIGWFGARMMTKGMAFLGKKLWQWKKIKLTLALKNFAGNHQDYRRFFFVSFFTLTCILPGMVIGLSNKKHSTLEADIRTGCTNLVVVDWTDNETLLEELNAREDIIATTEVTLYRYSFSKISIMELGLWTNNFVFILGIHSPENFSQIINLSQLGDVCYSVDQIKSLEQDKTYLMSKNFAGINRYATNQPSNHVKIVIREFDGEKFSGPPSSLEILPGSHTIKIDFVILGTEKSEFPRSKELRFDTKEGGEYAFGYPSSKPYKLFIYDINTGEKVSY